MRLPAMCPALPLLCAVAQCSAFHVRADALRAEVDSTGGVPRLRIDGELVPPVLFFFNTDIDKDKTERYLAEQVQLAAAAGIHLYSLPLRCPMLPDGKAPNFAYADGLLERFIRQDPEAKFLLRVYPGPNWSWAGWRDVAPEEFEWFLDGSRSEWALSLGSTLNWGPTDLDLERLVRRFESSPYAGRIIGYQTGDENFPPSFREKGPDIGPANTRRFRKWLRARYRTDAALRRAWGRADVALDTADVPRCAPGRFPMHGARGGETVAVFYDLPGERDWVDFSEYTSETTAERLLRFARIIRRETRGMKLACFFYGYTFELCGSFGGHSALARLLKSPDVDALASPYSYFERAPGGPGSLMAPIDSVAAHGKLWFSEDDTRTSFCDMTQVGDWAFFEDTARDADQTLGILDRNFARVLTHRAGTWWMDLTASGAFREPALWRMLQARVETMRNAYARPRPFRPDVAILVDEGSKHYVKSDWDVHRLGLVQLRDECARSGASVGYYLLSDFVEGIVPACKVYVFPNAFAISDADMRTIGNRLSRERATALWLHAPGLIGSAGIDVERASRLVGMRLEVADGVQGSRGVGPPAGLDWGPALRVSPRLVVSDPAVETLATYTSDGRVSAARVRSGGRTSIFFGDVGISNGALRPLLREAGAHIYTDGGEVVLCDGSYLIVHVGSAGDRTISPPPATSIRRLGSPETRRHGPVVSHFAAGETQWFVLSR